MDENLVAACQMFMVPASILFTALGVARTEALKFLLSILGAAIALVWLIGVLLWEGLSRADQWIAGGLAGVFLAAALISIYVHFRLWKSQWGGKSFIEVVKL